MGARVLKTKLQIPIHPSFILLFLWFLLNKNIVGFLLFVSVVLSHEYGHYFVAKKLGYKLDKFFIAPYGACLNYKEKTFEYKDEIKIALAGPVVNLMLSLIVVAFWWAFPNTYNFTYEFVSQSFILATFNLLPCYPLDGGRIFIGFASKFLSRKKAVKLTQIFNIIISIILFIAFVISCFYNFNPTLCLCGCFMLMGVFDSKNESKYQPAFLYKKKAKNFSKPLMLVVNAEVSLSQALSRIEANRFTVFIVVFSNSKTKFLDEQAIKLLSLSYPINMTIAEIFDKSMLKNDRRNN